MVWGQFEPIRKFVSLWVELAIVKVWSASEAGNAGAVRHTSRCR